MNPMELMQALTDMDDDVLLRAEQDPPRRRTVLPRLMRYAAAACLVVLLLLCAAAPTYTEAGDTSLKWRIVIDEEGINYIFENRPYPTLPMPAYDITWLPENYVLFRDFSKDIDRSICYQSSEDDMRSYWLHCLYVGKQVESSFSYSPDEYTTEPVTIQGIQGHHYRLINEDIGYLVWVDAEHQIMFSLSYSGDPETAMRVAESIRIKEGDSQ